MVCCSQRKRVDFLDFLGLLAPRSQLLVSISMRSIVKNGENAEPADIKVNHNCVYEAVPSEF